MDLWVFWFSTLEGKVKHGEWTCGVFKIMITNRLQQRHAGYVYKNSYKSLTLCMCPNNKTYKQCNP